MIAWLFFALICTLATNLYPLANIAVVLGFVPAYLTYRRRQKNPCPTSDPARWLRLAYTYWICSYLLTMASISNFLSFDFLRRDGAIFFGYLPLFLIGNYGLKSERARRLVNVYLGLMAAVAVIGALQFSASLGLLPNFLQFLPDSLVMVRDSTLAGLVFFGLFQAHNAAGGAYAIASVLALAMVVFSEVRPRVFSWSTLWFALTLSGLAMTKSRGAYLAFFVASALVFFRKKADVIRASKPLVSVVIPIALLLVLQPEVRGRLGSITSGEAASGADDPNILERVVYAQRAIGFIADSPLIGIGFGRYNDDNLQFYGIRKLVYIAGKGEVNNDDMHAHNSFLHFAAEGGIVGLVLMIGTWLAVYRWAKWAQAQLHEATFEYALARALQACVLLELLMSFTEHMLNSAVTTVTIFAMFGLLRNVIGRGGEKWSSSAHSAVRPLISPRPHVSLDGLTIAPPIRFGDL